MPSVIPEGFTLLTNQVERLNAEEVMPVIKAFLGGKGKTVYNSGLRGADHRQWVELRVVFQQGSYTLVFGVKEGRVVQLWVVLTAKGKIFCIDHPKAGIPSNHLSQVQMAQLTEMCVLPENKREVVVSTYYKIEMKDGPNRSGIGAMYDKGSSGPKGLSFPRALAGYNVLIEDEAEAQKVAQQLREYLSDISQTKDKEERSNALAGKRAHTDEDIAAKNELLRKTGGGKVPKKL